VQYIHGFIRIVLHKVVYFISRDLPLLFSLVVLKRELICFSGLTPCNCNLLSI
jgi:hypothetical protein